MIGRRFVFIILLTLVSCSPTQKKAELSEDYVLVEFAARLEEDYYKIYPQPLDKHEKEDLKSN